MTKYRSCSCRYCLDIFRREAEHVALLGIRWHLLKPLYGAAQNDNTVSREIELSFPDHWELCE